MCAFAVQPRFVAGSAGKLFALSYAPDGSETAHVLFVPPFGEELNKSRRMLHLQAVALAEHGIGSTLVDLFGTGDSEGDFCDATWEQWVDDLGAVRRLLRAEGRPEAALLGVRMGALLALEHASSIGTARAVLWQPWLDGRSEMNGLLKMRVAADRFSGERPDASVTAFREEIESRGSIEIGGYEISRRLFAALESRQLTALARATPAVIHWLDLAASEPAELSPPRRKVADELAPQVEACAVVGPKFWGTVEIETCPHLLDATTQRLAPR